VPLNDQQQYGPAPGSGESDAPTPNLRVAVVPGDEHTTSRHIMNLKNRNRFQHYFARRPATAEGCQLTLAAMETK